MRKNLNGAAARKEKAIYRMLLLAVIVCMVSGANCAHLKKKQAQQALVQHRSSNMRFMGYKLSVRTKGSPQEIEKYLLNPANIQAKAGGYELKMVSSNKLEKLGDTARFKFEVAGLSFPFKFTLVYHKPGEEIWFLGQADIGVMGLIRFKYEPMEGGTRVNLNYEMEDVKSFVGDLAEVLNMPLAIVKLMEEEIAKGQENFDPSMKAEELLAKGIRGEFYDTFFQTHEASIWINASPKKVNAVLHDPKTRLMLKEKSGFEYDSCFVTAEPGPCPVSVKITGIKYDFNSFPAVYKPEELLSTYWTSQLLIARNSIFMKPEKGGTRLGWGYEVELPSGISQGGGNLLMSILQIPEYLEKNLVGMKNYVEAGG